jgi:phage recombination protein Bet
VQRPAGVLAVREDQNYWTPDQLAALKALGVDESVTAADLRVYLTFCQRVRLDPFAKQCFLLRFAGKWQAVTARDGLRVIAERTGEYRGRTQPEWLGRDGVWRDVWTEADEPPVAARIGVRRAGWDEPVYGIAMWAERARYDRKGKLMQTWQDMPALMLAKVAEADALRATFPQDLASTHSIDEMPAPDRIVDQGPAPLTLQELHGAAITAVSVAEMQLTWREAARAKLLDADVTDVETGEVMQLGGFMQRRVHDLQAAEIDREIDPDTSPDEDADPPADAVPAAPQPPADPPTTDADDERRRQAANDGELDNRGTDQEIRDAEIVDKDIPSDG